MNADTYIKERVEDQMNYFDQKSIKNKKYYNILQVSLILSGILIPVLTGYSDQMPGLKYAVSILGCLIAFFSGLQSHYRYKENWTHARTASEALKRERFLYETKAGAYLGAADAYALFVEQVETILGSENQTWLVHTLRKEGE